MSTTTENLGLTKLVQTDTVATLMNGFNSNADILDNVLKLAYPVGSIYMSVNNTSPATLFGGTWEAIGGRFLIGKDSTYSAGSTGGSATKTIATANLPSHTHTVKAHSHGLNEHVHTVGGHVHSLNSHTHEVGAHSHGLNSHKHSIGAHSHGLNSHTHSIGAHNHGLNSHTHSVGAHSHGLNNHTHPGPIHWHDMHVEYGAVASSGTAFSPTGDGQYLQISKTSTTKVGYAVMDQYQGVTGGASGSTANSTAFNSGAASGNTANSTAFDSGGPSIGSTANSSAFDSGPASGSTANSTKFNSGGPSTTNTGSSSEFNTGKASGNTANSTAFNSGATGSGTALDIMPPYLSVYMWKRTA